MASKTFQRLCLSAIIGVVGTAAQAMPISPALLAQWTTGAGANNHYYGFVTGADIGSAIPSYGAASASAAAFTHLGETGYVATITSQEEQDFIVANLNPGGAFAWIGASDAAVEGQWQWIEGPEAGQLFPPSAAGFASWAPGEPNNFGVEDYAIAFWDGAGNWNDVPFGETAINAYLI